MFSESFFDAGGVAGFLALVWQGVKEYVGWRKRPHLRFESFDPTVDLSTWTFADRGNEQRRFVTLRVQNSSPSLATRCVATMRFIDRAPGSLHLQDGIALHWAGVDYSLQTTGAEPVDIGSEGRRLDIAFTVNGQQAPGCWVAMPLALALPVPHQAFLPAGHYEVEVTLACNGGKGESIRLRIHSPAVWQDLNATRVAA